MLDEFEKNYSTHIRPYTFDIPGPNICTNLRFDYEMLKWTDNEFTENKNFELKWKRRFGGFWDNRDNMHPIQPYQPGTSWQILCSGCCEPVYYIDQINLSFKKSACLGWLQKQT